MTDKKKAEKETKKIVSEDVENFFRDVWGKVVEYASLGAEEATKVSASAKTRVDIETLKFKRGKVLKMLGERYWELVEKDPSLAIAGTKEIIRQIKGIDREIKGLEKEIARKDQKAAKKETKKKASAKKATARKTSAKKPAASRKKTSPKAQPAPSAPPPEEPVSTPEGEENKGE